MKKTINIRESLSNLDKDTDFQYNLSTMYESANLSDEKKKAIAEMLFNEKDVETIYNFLNEAIGHMKDENTFAPLELASTLEVGMKVYKPNSDEIWTVKSLDPKRWYVDIIFEDEKGNEIFRSAGANSLWELVGENDTTFEVDDDWDIEWHSIDDYFNGDIDEDLDEDTIKTKSGKWVNKGKEGTHGEFKTKKEADAQRKAIFAQGWHEALDEDINREFVELPSFEQDWKKLKLSDEDLRALQNLILKGKEGWTPLGAEAYKIRFSPSNYQKGKDTAVRTVFIDIIAESKIYLVRAFSKGDQANLDNSEKKDVIKASKALHKDGEK